MEGGEKVPTGRSEPEQSREEEGVRSSALRSQAAKECGGWAGVGSGADPDKAVRGVDTQLP